MRSSSLMVAAAPMVAAIGSWSNLCPPGQGKCPQIMFGVACKDASLCVIVGGNSNTAESVYYSEDQFATFTKADMAASPPILLDVAMDASGHGVTADLGFIGTGILQSPDGKTWSKSHEKPFITGQCVEAMGNGEFAYVGGTGNKGSGQGVLFSKDNGLDWATSDWPVEIANTTVIRYGAFPSETVWYVTGGNFPTAPPSPSREAGKCGQVSETLCLAGHANAPNGDTYYGVITKTADAGKTWTKLFDTQKFYFNEISCLDEQNCIAAGEAHAGTTPGGYVMLTTDAGATWTQTFNTTNPGAGMFSVNMISATSWWAAGGDSKGSTIWNTADAGKTWALDGPQIRVVGEVMKMVFVDDKLGFAVAQTELQSSTILKYTA